jgi:fluoride exporter
VPCPRILFAVAGALHGQPGFGFRSYGYAHCVTALFVALAGAGGVLLRYGISSSFHGDTLPWVTVGINVVGSFLLGLLVVAHWGSPETRTTLGVGFLGGFTTFSTFSVQAFLHAEAGAPLRALIYVGASVGVGIAAAAAGYYLGRAIT